MKVVRLYIVGLFLFWIHVGHSQKNIFLSDDLVFPYLNQIDSLGSKSHTAIRPFQKSLTDIRSYTSKKQSGWDVLSLDFDISNSKGKPQVLFQFSPILSTMGGYTLNDSRDDATLDISVGLNSTLQIGTKLYATFNWVNQQSKLNILQEEYVNQKGVLAGIGEAKADHLIDDFYQQQFNTGYISYSPDQFFNFQLGRGKHFIGDGIRSLILSDAASPYEYLSIKTTFWKIQYMNLYTRMNDFTTTRGMLGVARKKYTTSHYLSYNVTKRLNIGLYESVIWQSQDSLVDRGFDVYYLNPIIFYRPVEFSLGSPDNAIIGVHASYRVSPSVKLYGQFVLDEFLLAEIRSSNGWWGNKQAAQLGLKYYNAFNKDGLTLIGEFNFIRPYTYAHILTSQNYGHANESLAHPFGANLREFIFSANYSNKKWFLEGRVSYLSKGIDELGTNYGGNILKSNETREKDDQNSTTQGDLVNLMTSQIRVSRQLGEINNFRLECSLRHYYNTNSSFNGDAIIFNIGVSSNLFNRQQSLYIQ